MSTQDQFFGVSALLALKHSPIRNYIVPGLTSWLIGEVKNGCRVRLFESSRSQQEHITPHSHRFDFRAMVLEGKVRNTIWRKQQEVGTQYDCGVYRETTLSYKGEAGAYDVIPSVHPPCYWQTYETLYARGEVYSMNAEDVHSIEFSRGAKVLIIEEPPRFAHSVILEPVVDGVTIPTFKVEPWMFQRGDA